MTLAPRDDHMTNRKQYLISDRKWKLLPVAEAKRVCFYAFYRFPLRIKCFCQIFYVLLVLIRFKKITPFLQAVPFKSVYIFILNNDVFENNNISLNQCFNNIFDFFKKNISS